MHIDKSIQLLSADSGKSAVDDTGHQNAGNGEAEFSELFSAELGFQEQQQGTAGSVKKSGQELAALLLQSAAAEQSSESNIRSGLSGDKVDKKPSLESVAEGAALAIGLQNLTGSQQATTAQMTGNTDDTDALTADPDAIFSDAEQAAEPQLWLKIISQSHDFNETLSKPPQVTPTTATINNAPLSTAEPLDVQLTGWATFDPATSATGDLAAMTGDLISATATDNAVTPEADLLQKSPIADADSKQALLDRVLLSDAIEATDPKSTPVESVSAEFNRLGNDKSAVHPTTLSTMQMNAQALNKADNPAQVEPLAAAMPTDKAKPDDRAPVMTDGTPVKAPEISPSEQHALPETLKPAAATAVPQPGITIDSGVSPVSQTEDKSTKLVGTLPIDIELPIDVVPDVQERLQLIPAAPAASIATGQSKPSAQTFAQFQKTVNAAAMTLQKQQLQSELTQGQPIQELTAQQPPRFAELNIVVSGQHSDTPTAFNALLQTERPISSGGSMGSSTGQQQQQATAQLFAAKLNDSVHSNEQPALNLLEPTAATQLKERVMFQVNQKIQSAEIKLAPEELGSMQIKVQLQQEQLSVQFVVQQAGAKEALEQQMPRLKEMLEEQGMQLTDGQVSQQREGTDDQKQARQRFQSAGQGSDIDNEQQQHQAMVRVSDRMVDYYA